METSLVGTFQFIVRKDMHLKWPRAETPTSFVTMGISEDCREHMKMAAFLAHELAALHFKVDATAASTIEPQHYRGEERAAEVTLLRKKPAPTCLKAGFFKRFGFDPCCNSGIG